MKKQAANALTIAGIILAVWANVLIWQSSDDYGLVLLLSTGVGLSDLDGRLARKYNIVTEVGVNLDKFRDKLFICPLFSFFLRDIWRRGGILISLIKGLIMLILFIELGLVLTWIYGFFKGLDVSAHKAGKTKMAIYFVAAGLVLLMKFLETEAITLPGPWPNLIVAGLLLPAAVYAIKSLAGYLERYLGPPK